jgi:hypothetical protein
MVIPYFAYGGASVLKGVSIFAAVSASESAFDDTGVPEA